MTTHAPQKTKSAQIEELLTLMGARERASVERHLAACDSEADPGHGQLWRRLAATLGALAPMPMRAIGPHAVLFFIPDGKYRMQVFALEDSRDGSILLYLPDVIAEAVKQKVLLKTPEGYSIGGASKHVLALDALDARNTTEAQDHVKNMTGWNRKALKVTLSAHKLNSPEVNATERLCSLAAKNWSKAELKQVSLKS